MTWHWSYKSLPELAGLSDDERRRVWGRCSRKAWPRPVVWVAAVAAVAASAVVIRLATPRVPLAGLGRFVVTTLVGGTVGWAVVTLMNQVLLHAVRPYLLRELPGRCRRCGYDLTGNASGACPECGRAVAV